MQELSIQTIAAYSPEARGRSERNFGTWQNRLPQELRLAGITTLFEKVHDNKQPANPIMPMELVRVTKDNLGDWARQLKDWGFTDVDPKYLALPSATKK